REILGSVAELRAEAPVDGQHAALARAFQKRIGGAGGAHLDGFDHVGRYLCVRLQPEEVSDALYRGILIGFGIVRKKLVADQAAVRPASDNVGEGSSAVDPELPPPVLCHRLTFHLSLLLLILGRRQRSMPAPLSPARYFLLQVISHGRADHATAPWPPGCAGRSPRGSPALHPACRD